MKVQLELNKLYYTFSDGMVCIITPVAKVTKTMPYYVAYNQTTGKTERWHCKDNKCPDHIYATKKDVLLMRKVFIERQLEYINEDLQLLEKIA